jgi:hypothetical protein
MYGSDAMMEKTERFGLALSEHDKGALFHLAEQDRSSAAAVVRRLIWREAKQRGIVNASGEQGRQVEQCKA